MIDLDVLRGRLHAALPQLTLKMVELEHSETRSRHPALSIETDERKLEHVYKMTITIIDDLVIFFVHVWGTSQETTTEGASRFSKACTDIDEVFAIAHSCWSEGLPS
jgi:hypothetical protein